jgi:hypothetical protein
MKLLSCSLDPTKPLDKPYEPPYKTDTHPHPLLLRVHWFIFLNQRRQFLPNTSRRTTSEDMESDLVKSEGTECIPLPFLQFIQAISSCPVTIISELRCTQTQVKPESRDAGLFQASLSSRHFAIHTRHVQEHASTSRRLEVQNSQEDSSRITKLLTEKICLRQVNHKNETIEIANPSQVCDISTFSNHSPIRSVASAACAIGSVGEDHHGDTNLDARSLFDDSPHHRSHNLTPTLPTPVVESRNKSQLTHKRLTTDPERTIRQLCFESPPESWSNVCPSSGLQDFEFPSHDDVSCLDYEPERSIEEFDIETGFARQEYRSAEKKQKKRKKEKKARKKKRRREFEDDVEHLQTMQRNPTPCRLTRNGVSKITPETIRGKGYPRSVDPFFDPRAKPYNPVSGHGPFQSQVNRATKGLESDAFLEARGKASQEVTQRTVKVVPHRPDPEPSTLQFSDHFDESCYASNDDDGLEIPHESPEPPTKRKRDEGSWDRSAAASMTAKRSRNHSSLEVHVLCSESFIEHSSPVVASLAAGSWLEDTDHESFALSTREAPCRRILAYDSCLLDDIGIDIEIPARGAIIVQKLSSWATEEDLKVLIRRLVKLSAHGRYLQIKMIICIDTDMSPASAKGIALMQSAPLGNVDCMVSFQLVAPTSVTGAIASTILLMNAQACCDLDSSVFNSIGECTAKASFLLRLVSSFTVVDTLQLLCGKDGKSPRKLWQVLGSPNFIGRSGAQLRLAAQAPLNKLGGA